MRLNGLTQRLGRVQTCPWSAQHAQTERRKPALAIRLGLCTENDAYTHIRDTQCSFGLNSLFWLRFLDLILSFSFVFYIYLLIFDEFQHYGRSRHRKLYILARTRPVKEAIRSDRTSTGPLQLVLAHLRAIKYTCLQTHICPFKSSLSGTCQQKHAASLTRASLNKSCNLDCERSGDQFKVEFPVLKGTVD